MGQRGFSLIEAVVATALTLAVMTTALALVHPGQEQFGAQPEAIDMQQRLRVAAGALYGDLVQAGAGMARGPNRGPLAHFFAPVLPYRQGTDRDDPPGTFMRNAITVMSVPLTAAQTTLASRGTGEMSEIWLNSDVGCPSGDSLCGFRKGMALLVYDASGLYDTFAVTDAQGGGLQLQRRGRGLTHDQYPPDKTTVAQLANVVYYLRSDPLAGVYQLMSHDGGGGNDVPVVDHLVDFELDYYGDPNPPMLTGRALTDPVGPWTTYGPAPPPRDRQVPTNGYPPGENCTFAVDPSSDVQRPRLDVLSSSEATSGVVRLSPAQLTDGPWCPDSSSPNRWDADLLRIRTIRAAFRVQAANRAFRGPAGLLFLHGGTSAGGHRFLPDRQVRLDITPRNLQLAQ